MKRVKFNVVRRGARSCHPLAIFAIATVVSIAVGLTVA